MRISRSSVVAASNKALVGTAKRDERNPLPTNPSVTRSMKGNVAKNTSPEIILRKALLNDGFRGIRYHYKNIPGRPDICLPYYRIAIFVNGCFWHRGPYCRQGLPKSHRSFWADKFRRNKIRDSRKRNQLNYLGWR